MDEALGLIFPWIANIIPMFTDVMAWVLSSAPEIEAFGNPVTFDANYSIFIRIEKLYFKYLDVMLLQLTYNEFAGIIICHLANGDMNILVDFEPQLGHFLLFWNARPRAGGIILDYTRKFILLVRPPHSWNWSFPKKKLEPLEGELVRAITEVEEETGIRFNADENYERIDRDVLNSDGATIRISLFYMKGTCAIESLVRPRSHQEIGGARWFNIDYLSSRTDQEVENDPEFGTAAWRSIKPFLDEIRERAYASPPTHCHDYEEKCYRGFGDVQFD